MFQVNSITSSSRYQAQLNSAQSRLRLTQDREDIAVNVSKPSDQLTLNETQVTIEFLDTFADAGLTIQLKADTAFKLAEKLSLFLHDKHISVGNDDHYVAVDE